MLLVALRLSRLAIHFLLGLASAPLLAFLRPAGREALLRWWAHGILRALGVRLQTSGSPRREAGLVVANHISWLDVAAVVALRPALFVCKSEVAAWPAIGWLLRRAGTLFLRRGSARDVWRLNQRLRERLDAGQTIAAFPEGTTSDGAEVLEFRPALFQPALERGFPVYPVAIVYSTRAASFVGDTTFLQSLLAIARAPRLELRIAFLEPLQSQGRHRRALARRAREAIALRRFGLELEAAVYTGAADARPPHPQRADSRRSRLATGTG